MSLNSRLHTISYILLVLFVSQFAACLGTEKDMQVSDIIIENAEMKLILSRQGTAKNLIHKATGQACLIKGLSLPVFSITQDRPYDDEVQLAYPAKRKTFGSNSIHRVGDDLVVGFELTEYEATIGLNLTHDYIGFTLKNLGGLLAYFRRRNPGAACECGGNKVICSVE